MKKLSIIAIPLIAVMMFVGCSHTTEVSKNADEILNVSISASCTENSNSKIVTENESSTQISTTETTTTTKPKETQKSTTSKTTAKPNDIKSAGQTTTKKQSETTVKKDNSQTTAAKKNETTKAVVTTTKSTTTKKVATTEKDFDINYWVNYAKSYAKSVGLNLNSEAVDCWDNPINANSDCKYLERDITDRLNRYAKNDDMTDVWIWAEKTGSNSYQIYIGYA